MYLDELPTELLSMVVRRLCPRERLPLRRASRRFCSLVEAEGLLPFNPARIYIDFWRQIVAVFMHEDRNDQYISLANGNVRSGEWSSCQPSYPEKFPSLLFDVNTMSSIRNCFYDVGDNWTKYVNDYLRRLNKHFNPNDFSQLIITLGEEVPPQLLNLSIRIQVVDIHASHPVWINRSLPDSLVSWTGKVLKERGSSISVYFAPMSPHQLELIAPIDSMFISGFLNDDGATYLLEMFDNQRFPSMDCWFFKLPPNSTRFLSTLVSSLAIESLEPEIR